MKHVPLAVACLALGGVVGYVAGRGDRAEAPARGGALVRESDTAAILEEIDRLREEVRSGRAAPPPAPGRDTDRAPERDRTDAALAALQEAGVVLDPRDVESAVRVLEAYTCRRERRWWEHSLERFVRTVRAQEEKLRPTRKPWLRSLDEASADVRAVVDADGLEAWINRYRSTLSILPGEVDLDPIWGEWLRFRGDLR
jgi:hypothetical protein